MAVDEAVASVAEALEEALQMRLPRTSWTGRLPTTGCGPASRAGVRRAHSHTCVAGGRADLIRLLRHAAVANRVGFDSAGTRHRGASGSAWLTERLPRELVERAAVKLSPVALSALRLSRSKTRPTCMLRRRAFCSGPVWLAPKGPCRCVSTAPTCRRGLGRIDLSGASVLEADLSGRQPGRSELARAGAGRANFAGAVLRRADLREIQASGAEFTDPNLSEVNGHRAVLAGRAYAARASHGRAPGLLSVGRHLSGASLRSADLSYARLAGAVITDADFCDSNLTGAALSGLRLREASFLGARFYRRESLRQRPRGYGATGRQFRGGIPDRSVHDRLEDPARLFPQGRPSPRRHGRHPMEQADLREADLRGCVFHMGSSRSGLVGSPLASEGTRTGSTPTNTISRVSARPGNPQSQPPWRRPSRRERKRNRLLSCRPPRGQVRSGPARALPPLRGDPLQPGAGVGSRTKTAWKGRPTARIRLKLGHGFG